MNASFTQCNEWSVLNLTETITTRIVNLNKICFLIKWAGKWEGDEYLNFRLDYSILAPLALCFLLETQHGRANKVFLDKLDFKFHRSKDHSYCTLWLASTQRLAWGR